MAPKCAPRYATLGLVLLNRTGSALAGWTKSLKWPAWTSWRLRAEVCLASAFHALHSPESRSSHIFWKNRFPHLAPPSNSSPYFTSNRVSNLTPGSYNYNVQEGIRSTLGHRDV
jgi:hypothetical protein